MPSNLQDVAVIGGGTMGSGIAHAFALSGRDVVLIESNAELAAKALAGISKNMDRQVAKNTISAEQKQAALIRIKTALDISAAAKAQLVVEAVPEILALKQDVFHKLDAACPQETILASNTSSIPISALAAATKRPDRVIGMHFMNPVPIMKLVEIVRGEATSDATFEAVRATAVSMGKVSVVSKDFPGFISNRVLMPMINEACIALMEGVASREDIDTVMKLGMAHPMGPLELADLIGLDVCLSIMEVLEDGFKNPKYKPCPLLRQMVEAGRLGRKTKGGFYDY
jgi:3-hydroxybutyryl-CoA dehydrogenase